MFQRLSVTLYKISSRPTQLASFYSTNVTKDLNAPKPQYYSNNTTVDWQFFAYVDNLAPAQRLKLLFTIAEARGITKFYTIYTHMLQKGINRYVTKPYNIDFVLNAFLDGFFRFNLKAAFENEIMRVFNMMKEENLFPNENNTQLLLKHFLKTRNNDNFYIIFDHFVNKEQIVNPEAVLNVMMQFNEHNRVRSVVNLLIQKKVISSSLLVIILQWYENRGDYNMLQKVLDSVDLSKIPHKGALSAMLARLFHHLGREDQVFAIWNEYQQDPFVGYPNLLFCFLQAFSKKSYEKDFFKVIKIIEDQKMHKDMATLKVMVRGFYIFGKVSMAEDIIAELKQSGVTLLADFHITRYLGILRNCYRGTKYRSLLLQAEADLLEHRAAHPVFMQAKYKFLMRKKSWAALFMFLQRVIQLGIPGAVEYTNQAMMTIISMGDVAVARKFKNGLKSIGMFDVACLDPYVHGMIAKKRPLLVHEAMMDVASDGLIIPERILTLVFDFYIRVGKRLYMEQIIDAILSRFQKYTRATPETWYTWKALRPVLMKYGLMEQLIVMFSQIHNLYSQVPPPWVTEAINKCEDIGRVFYVARFDEFAQITPDHQ